MPPVIDLGSGPPVVVVPGVQGRWEWMRPAIEHLAARCRVVCESLCDPGRLAIDGDAGFGRFVQQLDDVFEKARLTRAAVCGISYGGLIAVRYAAVRPERVSALVLASTPPPGWLPQAWIRRYIRRPMISAPFFALRSPGRLGPEIAAAHATWRARAHFTAGHLARIMRAPASPVRMARRVRFMLEANLEDDVRRLALPALVITGEAPLDRVVPVEETQRYVAAIAGARHAVIEGTGHIGLVTKPARFAELVGDFVQEHASGGRP